MIKYTSYQRQYVVKSDSSACVAFGNQFCFFIYNSYYQPLWSKMFFLHSLAEIINYYCNEKEYAMFLWEKMVMGIISLIVFSAHPPNEHPFRKGTAHCHTCRIWGSGSFRIVVEKECDNPEDRGWYYGLMINHTIGLLFFCLLKCNKNQIHQNVS
jgi:hypothetical protein